MLLKDLKNKINDYVFMGKVMDKIPFLIANFEMLIENCGSSLSWNNFFLNYYSGLKDLSLDLQDKCCGIMFEQEEINYSVGVYEDESERKIKFEKYLTEYFQYQDEHFKDYFYFRNRTLKISFEFNQFAHSSLDIINLKRLISSIFVDIPIKLCLNIEIKDYEKNFPRSRIIIKIKITQS